MKKNTALPTKERLANETKHIIIIALGIIMTSLINNKLLVTQFQFHLNVIIIIASFFLIIYYIGVRTKLNEDLRKENDRQEKKAQQAANNAYSSQNANLMAV